MSALDARRERSTTRKRPGGSSSTISSEVVADIKGDAHERQAVESSAFQLLSRYTVIVQLQRQRAFF